MPVVGLKDLPRNDVESHRTQRNPPPQRQTPATPFGGSRLPPLKDVFMPGFTCKSFIFLITVIQFVMFCIEFKDGINKRNKNFGPNVSAMTQLRAVMKSLIQKGEVDRFFIALLLHVDFVRFVMNAGFQLMIGFTLEKKFGSLRFALIYILSGALGFMLSAAVRDEGMVILGAAGAIMGILGAGIADCVLNWNAGTEAEQIQRKGSMCVYCCFAFFSILSISVDTMVEKETLFQSKWFGVDHWGHIGGFVSGITLAFIIPPKVENPCSCATSPFCYKGVSGFLLTTLLVVPSLVILA